MQTDLNSGSSGWIGIFVVSSGKSGGFNEFGARYVSSVQSDEADSSRSNFGGQLFFPESFLLIYLTFI